MSCFFICLLFFDMTKHIKLPYLAGADICFIKCIWETDFSQGRIYNYVNVENISLFDTETSD